MLPPSKLSGISITPTLLCEKWLNSKFEMASKLEIKQATIPQERMKKGEKTHPARRMLQPNV